MKVIICGGRDFIDKVGAFIALDRIHKQMPITFVMHGGATGADQIGGMWAARNHIKYEIHVARWKELGRAAGPIRNETMLAKEPDAVIAFPGNQGTAHMMMIARKKGVKVIEPMKQEKINATN